MLSTNSWRDLPDQRTGSIAQAAFAPNPTEPTGRYPQPSNHPSPNGRVLRSLTKTMPDSIPRKVYYSIGDTCELIGVKPHVIRYWETQFPQMRPMKNRQGHRIYKAAEINVVIFIKHLLYVEKHTIEEARRIVAKTLKSSDGTRRVKAIVTPGVLATMRSDLIKLRNDFDLPPTEPSP